MLKSNYRDLEIWVRGHSKNHSNWYHSKAWLGCGFIFAFHS